jgi:hypothetical protein
MTGDFRADLLKMLRGFAMAFDIFNSQSDIDNNSHLRYIAIIHTFTDGDLK